MNFYEKVGVIGLLVFFGTTFPESWRGAEAIFFYIGGVLFLGGKVIEDFIKA